MMNHYSHLLFQKDFTICPKILSILREWLRRKGGFSTSANACVCLYQCSISTISKYASVQAHVCACMCDTFLYSKSDECSSKIFPLRKPGGGGGGGREWDEMFESKQKKMRINRFHNMRGSPKGHSLSVHPHTLSKSFHVLLRWRVARAAARLSSRDQSWRPQ